MNAGVSTIRFRNTIQSALPSHIKHSSIGFKEALNYADDGFFPLPPFACSPALSIALSSIRQRRMKQHRDEASGVCLALIENSLQFFRIDETRKKRNRTVNSRKPSRIKSINGRFCSKEAPTSIRCAECQVETKACSP